MNQMNSAVVLKKKIDHGRCLAPERGQCKRRQDGHARCGQHQYAIVSANEDTAGDGTGGRCKR
jgi:hypothetical protein